MKKAISVLMLTALTASTLALTAAPSFASGRKGQHRRPPGSVVSTSPHKMGKRKGRRIARVHVNKKAPRTSTRGNPSRSPIDGQNQGGITVSG